MSFRLVLFKELQQLKDKLAILATEFRLVSQHVLPQLLLALKRALALWTWKFLVALEMVSERLDWDEFSAQFALLLGSVLREMLEELLNGVKFGGAYGAFIHVVLQIAQVQLLCVDQEIAQAVQLWTLVGFALAGFVIQSNLLLFLLCWSLLIAASAVLSLFAAVGD